MVEFSFYLSDDDFDRMTVIKKRMGHDDLTYNQFAKELLHKELYKLQPQRPTEEELEEC